VVKELYLNPAMQPFALLPQPFTGPAVANADSIREHSGSPYIPTEARKQLKHADAAQERKNEERKNKDGVKAVQQRDPGT
jgi:hypothetical protein